MGHYSHTKIFVNAYYTKYEVSLIRFYSCDRNDRGITIKIEVDMYRGQTCSRRQRRMTTEACDWCMTQSRSCDVLSAVEGPRRSAAVAHCPVMSSRRRRCC